MTVIRVNLATNKENIELAAQKYIQGLNTFDKG